MSSKEPGSAASGAPLHPLEERKAELESLIADVERGQTLAKADVVSRLGRPDGRQETGHKEFSDRIISTRYRYKLPPGEYSFTNSEHATLGEGWRVDFNFSEYVNYGPRGRLATVVDEMTPISFISVSDSDSSDKFVYPSRKRFMRTQNEKGK